MCAAEFRPAFDIPKTVEQAIAMLETWGQVSTMTFDPRRAAAAAQILKYALIDKEVKEKS